jgi:hypothetical protein
MDSWMPAIRDNLTNRSRLTIDFHLHWESLAVCGALILVSVFVTGISAVFFGGLNRIHAARVTGRFRGRQAILSAQIGLCVLLVALEVMLARGFAHLRYIPTGFRAEHVLTFSLDPALSGYAAAAGQDYERALLKRLNATSHVVSVAAAARGVLRDSGFKTTVSKAGRAITPADDGATSINRVSEDYFATLGMNVLAGRKFKPDDYREARPAAIIVNQAFAAKYSSGKSPLNHYFGHGPSVAAREYVVVGVVNDTKYRSLREPTIPIIFTTESPDEFVLYVRVDDESAAVRSSIERMISAADPNVPILESGRLSDDVNDSVAPERVGASLGGIYAMEAILVVAVGLWGVFKALSLQRTKEFGIRAALGAGPLRIAAYLGRSGLNIVLFGIAIGCIGFAMLRPLLSKWTAGAPSDHLLAIGIAAATIVAATTAAIARPAWRASHIAPSEALRGRE